MTSEEEFAPLSALEGGYRCLAHVWGITAAVAHRVAVYCEARELDRIVVAEEIRHQVWAAEQVEASKGLHPSSGGLS